MLGERGLLLKVWSAKTMLLPLAAAVAACTSSDDAYSSLSAMAITCDRDTFTVKRSDEGGMRTMVITCKEKR